MIVGLAVAWLVIVALAALIGPFLAPNPTHQDLVLSLKAPGPAGGGLQHPFGTDQLGRDELSRLLSSARVSLAMSIASLLAACLFGVALGILSGYYRGIADTVLMRVVDVQMSIPGILLAVTVVSVLGPKVPSVLLVLALYAWVVYARVTRAEVLSIGQREYVTAARALGCSSRWILRKHIFRNVTSSIVVISTLELPNLIIIQASLGYLGLSIPPPTSDLGSMIADGQKFLTVGDWWLTLFPGAVIALIVLAVNVLGDWMRDFFDPRARFLRSEGR